MSGPVSYRAPSQDGEALISPSIAGIDRIVEENVRLLRSLRWSCGQTPLDQIRLAARTELLRSAQIYTSAYRPTQGYPSSPLTDAATRIPDAAAFRAPDAASSRIIMSGHQPTLFHPGVWFKNFAIDRIARVVAEGQSRSSQPRDVVAINLVIDNDVSINASIAVPFLDPTGGLVQRSSVAYDTAAGGLPFEQNPIHDFATFESFAASVRAVVSPLVPDPLVTRLWPHAVAAARRCENVACAIAQARHALEAELGLRTLEVPLSVICRGEPFMTFILPILHGAARFREVYNVTAAEYRRVHHIRSAAHPVSDLGIDGEWIELPLWVYSDASPQRKQAWVRRYAGGLEIGDRQKLSIHLPETKMHDPAELVRRCGRDFKLRPRALVTTMFARLVLCDLFIHGIGGATYDELGDQITERFFGVRPPRWMLATATVRLPVDRKRLRFQARGVAAVRDRIRRTRYAPETFAGEADLPEHLVAEKRRLIANEPPRGNRKAWHDAIDAINLQLAAKLDNLRERLAQELIAARSEEASQTILQSREHPFCLFPVEHLVGQFDRLLR